MDFEVLKAKRDDLSFVLELDVELRIKGHELTLKYIKGRMKDDNWEYLGILASYEFYCENGSIEIENFLKSEEMTEQILNHKKIRLIALLG